MNKFVIIAFIIRGIVTQCASQCLTCQTAKSPYSCLSCSPDNTNIYFFSCPSAPAGTTPFIIITVLLTLLHLFMLFVGIGVYRDIFQNIQLASLINWRYGLPGGTTALQGTNLAVVRNNDFPDSFGGQFIAVLCVLGLFWILMVLVDRIPHSPTAILLRRKKIIFPVRIITLIFNILLYVSLMQVTTTPTESAFDTFAFVLAVLALTVIVAMVIGVGVASNWKRFQVDDPHYYVLLQEIVSKRWYAKNSVLLSLVSRGIIIIAFVALFSQPYIAGIIMVIVQMMTTLYLVALIRYTKLRYYLFIVATNVLMIGIILTSFIGAVETIGGTPWNSLSLAYITLIMVLVAIYFIATTIQVTAKRDIIAKQLRSIYRRFIICEKNEENIAMTKYDQHSHRERVTEFKENMLYHRPLANSKTAEIQLQESPIKRNITP